MKKEEVVIIMGVEHYNNIMQRLSTIDTKLDEITKPAVKILLTEAEVRKLLSICSKTLQNYRNQGLLSFSQHGRKIFYTQDDIDAFLEEHKCKIFK